MISPQIKLHRLRGIFVAYYALKSIVGAVVAFSILRPIAGHSGLRGWSPGSLAVFSLMVAAVVLAVALFIFARLLERKNWARLLLLALGWLAVVSAVFSLLAASQLGEAGGWISRLVPDLDWKRLMEFDRVQKIFEFIFWGYLIAVLQFDEEVKKEFSPQAGSGGAPIE